MNYNYYNFNQNNIQEKNNLKTKIKDLENEKELIINNYTQINEETQAQLKKKENEFDKLKNDYQNILGKMNKLSDENKTLKTYYKNISTTKQKEITELQEKLREKGEELNQKNIKIYMYEKEIKEKTEQLVNVQNKLNKVINDYKNDIQRYKEELQDTHSKFDGAINNFDKQNKENLLLKEKVESLTKNIKEINTLENKANQLQDIIDINKTKEDYLKKKAEDFYDVIIDIDSIVSLKKTGWKIKYNKERKEIYDKIISEKTIKLGVLGLNNVGKSYLLSKIAKIDIPTGYSIETKGISIKYSEAEKGEEQGMCILDSAGFETPLLIDDLDIENNIKYNDDKNLESIINRNIIEEELSKDKAQTERFIEELIISLSDIIILVIGKLTRTEQRLINRIKAIAKNNDKNKIKSMIIVHNLAQYHRIAEVEAHISNYLWHSATFKLIKNDVRGFDEFKDRYYLVENSDKPDDKDIDVYHYIMAKEGTEAGNYYNNLTIKLIKQLYNQSNKRNQIDIPKEISLLFSDLSSEIIGEKIDRDKLEIQDDIIILNENSENKNNNTIIKSTYNLQNTYIDQDGKYLRNKEFEPKYSLYYYRVEGDDDDDCENYLLLRMEIPGNIDRLTARKTNLKTEKYKGILIKGHKNRDEFEEQKTQDLKEITDNRKYGDFAYFIELKQNLEIHKNHAIKDTDIYEFIFNNKNREKKENANNNNDIVEGIKIASGVYVMKFELTQGSYV